MTISYEDARSVLEELAAERPDYVYRSPLGTDSCVYGEDESTPSCIIGHLIYRLDPEIFPEVVREYNSSGASAVVGAYADLFQDSQKIRELLTWTQVEQDAGTPWKESVAIGIENSKSYAE